LQVEVTDPQTGEAVNQTVLRMYWLDAHEDPVKHPGRDVGGRSNDQRKDIIITYREGRGQNLI
jgi:hypothetical protein